MGCIKPVGGNSSYVRLAIRKQLWDSKNGNYFYGIDFQHFRGTYLYAGIQRISSATAFLPGARTRHSYPAQLYKYYYHIGGKSYRAISP